MGKRKERRLAAHSNAGRRFKLDLSAEPSGDLVGSTGNDEGGGDVDPTQHAGLPSSPSSSGKQPQNPLLLLGQYSDDELDEEPNSRLNHTDAEISSLDHDGQDGPPSEGKEVGANAVEDLSAQKGELREVERDSAPADVLQSLEGGGFGNGDSTASNDKGTEMDLAQQVSVTGTCDEQVNGDVGLGWRIVMHEESNQYYYWNTVTGETSWEVPEILAQTTRSVSHQIMPPAENMETTPVDSNQASSTFIIELDGSSAALTVGGSVAASLVSQSQEMHVNGPQIEEWVEQNKSDSVKDKNSAAGVNQSESQTDLTAAHVLLDGEVTKDELENGIDLPTNLMGRCECLLERLKSLEGYGSRLQCQDQMSKYILEVDIRFADIKSLSSYASSLLPFWIHSQRQLKQLEDVINNEIYHLAVSAQMDDDVGASFSSPSNEKEKSSIFGDNSTVGIENNRKSALPNFTPTVEFDLHDDLNVEARHAASLGLSDEHMRSGAAVHEKENGAACLEPEFLPEDDVDMDVDMEVDEEVSDSITALEGASSTEVTDPLKQENQPNIHAEYATLPSAVEATRPLPPEEDWIPPPPPDSDHVPPPPPENEQVPPPPPDEPPESSYPSLPVPSYMETGQPHTYAEQYHLSYPDSGFQYYGPTVTVSSSDLYGCANGSQVVVPHGSLYYETVPITYADTAPIIVNPVDPVAFFNVQEGSLAPAPVVSITGSSHLHAESRPLGYSTFASDHIRTHDDPVEGPRKVEVDISVACESATASGGVTSTSITDTPATTSAQGNISALPTIAVTDAAAVPTTTIATKGQFKVSRGKKRTVSVASSLRSNKKVSSLVDKWKAAKEELNENDEDEPENAYEILERKRQREIEEWHAKQIASGEAKDNANFQPLGGDWRERVKRRRAQAAKKAAQAPPEAPVAEKQKPKLAELSKGLPSGWQAYWDEASKQVYYGNLITSKTTWDKPTK